MANWFGIGEGSSRRLIDMDKVQLLSIEEDDEGDHAIWAIFHNGAECQISDATNEREAVQGLEEILKRLRMESIRG